MSKYLIDKIERDLMKENVDPKLVSQLKQAMISIHDGKSNIILSMKCEAKTEYFTFDEIVTLTINYIYHYMWFYEPKLLAYSPDHSGLNCHKIGQIEYILRTADGSHIYMVDGINFEINPGFINAMSNYIYESLVRKSGSSFSHIFNLMFIDENTKNIMAKLLNLKTSNVNYIKKQIFIRNLTI